MNKIYMTYRESREGGEVCKGDEDRSYPNHEDNHIEFEPLSLSTKAGNWVESIDVDFNPETYIGKDLHLVVVRYSSGDTFGSTYGNWTVIGVFTNHEDARKEEKDIRNNTGKWATEYKNNTGKWATEYKPWEGYFERFESVEIDTFELSDKIK